MENSAQYSINNQAGVLHKSTNGYFLLLKNKFDLIERTSFHPRCGRPAKPS